MISKQELIVENAKIILPGLKNQNILQTFVFDPEKGKEDLGQLAILIHIQKDTIDNREIAHGLIEVIKAEYYQDPSKKQVKSLEESLIKANEILSEIASFGKVAWVGNLDVIIASLKGRSLIFAQTGKMIAVLFRDGEIIKINPSEDKNEENQPLKTFSGITSGELEHNDYILFSRNSLLELFSGAKLAQVVCQKEINDTKRIFEEIYSDDPNQEALGVIMMRVRERKRAKKNLESFRHQEKLEEYPEIVEATVAIEEEEMLIPQAISRRLALKRREKFPYVIFYFLSLALKLFGSALLKLTKLIYEGARFVLSKAYPMVIDFALLVFQQVNNLLHRVKSLKKKRIIGINTRNSEEMNYFTLKPKTNGKDLKLPSIGRPKRFSLAIWNNLALYKKLAVVTPVIIFLAVGVGLNIWHHNTKNKSVAIKNEETILKQAEEKRKMALDATIYQDNEKARALLTEAGGLVGQVLGSTDYKERASSLQEQITLDLNKMDNLTTVEPEIIFDINRVNTALEIKDLIQAGEDLYLLAQAGNAIFRVKPETKEATQLSPTFSNLGELNFGASIDSNKNIIFVNNNSELAVFNINAATVAKISNNSPFTDAAISSIGEYSNKIYALLPEQNQIIKYSRVVNGLSQGVSWIKNGEVKNGVSLAIDGNVYVLTKDGKILKFYAGESKDYNLEIKPGLSSPTKLYTRMDLKNIYLIDPPSKRIVVINKEKNNVAQQYINDQFVDLKDITVSQDEQKIYVLAGQKILSIGNK